VVKTAAGLIGKLQRKQQNTKGFSKSSALRVKLLVCKYTATESRAKSNKEPEC
jgi:hypothetical protein